VDIQGYVDFDWEEDVHTRRSMSGYMFQLFCGAVRWRSK
jgi:hypothetical protein